MNCTNCGEEIDTTPGKTGVQYLRPCTACAWSFDVLVDEAGQVVRILEEYEPGSSADPSQMPVFG